MCSFACAVSWATWVLFSGVPAWCAVLRVLVRWATWLLFTGVPAGCVALRVRYPGPLGSCSPVCPLGALPCVCGILGHLAPVHRCARSLCCLCVRCPGPLGSCSPVCPLAVLSVCAVSRATWLLFTSVPARCSAFRVRCPGPFGSCSTVCPLGLLYCVFCVLGHLASVHRRARSVCVFSFCLCGVLGHLAPVHRCARSVCCVTCAVSWATWLVFTGVPARCVAFRVRCPGPLGSCAPLCLLGVWFCLCGVLGHLAQVLRCARSVCCVACAVSWATWLLFTGVPARCVALRVRCPGPLRSRSPVCPLGAAPCVCHVLGHLAPVHRCARSVCCLCVRCPSPLGSCSPMCPLGLLCCVCGVPGHLAPVHRCARSVRTFAGAVSWAT